MKRFFAAVLMLGMFSLAPLPVAAQGADSNKAINEVIETFRTAIINKDRDAFLKLFLKDDITWAGVTTDASIEHIYATRPDSKLKRPPKTFNSNPKKFIEGIIEDKGTSEETFSNVRIDTDGDVAQVWFDYSFIYDGYKTNWGKESWQMVRTGTGWKIAAVIWSMEFNQQPPPKPSAL